MRMSRQLSSSGGERNSRIPLTLQTVAVTVLLLLGNASPVVSQFVSLGAASISSLEVANAASQAITAGATVASVAQSLANRDSSVTCSIYVENWTRYPLLYPSVQVNGQGALVTPARPIRPGKREVFAVSKPRLSATGVTGTVSWEVVNKNRRFVLMWSAPFDFGLYSNWLGLGMTRAGLTQTPDGQEWYDQMYYGRNSSDLRFARKEYTSSRTNYLLYRDGDFEIVGTMSNIHRVWVEVSFRPVQGRWDLLADSFYAPLRRIIESPRP